MSDMYDDDEFTDYSDAVAVKSTRGGSRSMTGRRNYRDAGNDRQESPPTRRSGSGGGGNQQEGEFKIITGLFASKSGKADTVFVTPEIAAELKKVQAGDTLGVSMGKKSQRLSLWYIAKEN